MVRILVDDGIETMAGVIGSGIVLRPTHAAIGTGSDTLTAGDTALLTETDRNAFTSVDLTVAKDATFVADFSSTEISGTAMQEYGLFNAAAAGSMFNREIISTITFEGDRELQLQTTFRFAKSGA